MSDQLAVFDPPRDLNAEQAIIGSVLVDPDSLEFAADLAPSDFYAPRAQQAWRAVLELYREGASVDPFTIANRISTDAEGRSAAVVWLSSATDGMFRPAHTGSYAEIIRERATARRLAGRALEIVEAAQAGRPSTDLLRMAQEATQAAESVQRPSFLPLSTTLDETYASLEARKDGRGIIGLPTGFNALDRLLCGLRPGNMCVLAARPSMGKTALALNIAARVALEDPARVVGIFSLEMSRDELQERLLASVSGVSFTRMRNGRLFTEDWDHLARGKARLDETAIHIDDTGALPVADLRTRARRLASQKGTPALLVIDYLQLCRSGGHRDNKVAEVTDISAAIKALAKEMGCPVLVLSQLSRLCEQRTDRRPVLSDLRESGAIEQDADIVLFLYRAEQYVRHDDPNRAAVAGKAEAIVAKHRNGQTGVACLTWLGDLQRFEDAI